MTKITSTNNSITVSVILPAKNEGKALPSILRSLKEIDKIHEIIVVDDGSQDSTSKLESDDKTQIIHLPYSIGNGGAVKTGARLATGDILIFMDADGQHSVDDIPRLLDQLHKGGYDMVIGARSKGSQANIFRSIANRAYNHIASWMVGQEIIDLTSGFRAVRAEKFKEYLHLLPNGFSYPTTITMAFFRSGYTVNYLPIKTNKRVGKSHITPLRDGMRFLLIIFKVGTLFSPIKLFGPLSLFFGLLGATHYAYTYITAHRFTNMSVLLFSASVIIFLIGLISEQITQLMYQKTQK